jgi:pimeloyl-ACP methyl ester carboxylesterase
VRHWARLSGPILFVLLMQSLSAEAAPWRDPSPHTVRFVTVDDGARLEVLDWGGSGRSVVLLAGGGPTAHVFDDFAPKLAMHYRVYGITRRGFGASGFAESPNPLDRLRDDLLSALDALGLDDPVLAGSSIAGAEMSAIADSHPRRIAGLVYLDAAYPYAFDDGTGPAMRDFTAVEGLGELTPAAADLQSFAALQAWDERVNGFRTPEAEIRQRWESDGETPTGKQRKYPGSRMFSTILGSAKKYDRIPVPALAIFALPHIPERWIRESNDPSVRKASRAFLGTIDALTEKQAKAIQAGVPTARVVRVPGSHHIFLSNESDVRREMREFIDSLKSR